MRSNNGDKILVGSRITDQAPAPHRVVSLTPWSSRPDVGTPTAFLMEEPSMKQPSYWRTVRGLVAIGVVVALPVAGYAQEPSSVAW